MEIDKRRDLQSNSRSSLGKLAEGKERWKRLVVSALKHNMCRRRIKNNLWNQLRANYTGVPIKILEQKETTVLGASFFIQTACGNYSSPEEARSAVDYRTRTIMPEQSPPEHFLNGN
jgi:hypothetical protein